jgi:hypothetical protein
LGTFLESGILFSKLFSPKKNILVAVQKQLRICKMRICKITGSIYLNSERSEQFPKQNFVQGGFFATIFQRKKIKKVENILKSSLGSFLSPSPSVKIQIMEWKVCLRCKGKLLLMSTMFYLVVSSKIFRQ